MVRREPYWVKLFLRELERTGNVRISAKRAGVDYTSAYQRRKRHAEFAERWEGAVRALALRQAQYEREVEEAPALPEFHPTPAPPHRGKGRSEFGQDTVVRPDGKVIKSSEARWGKRAQERFLTELTVNGNVRRAAEAAGFSTTAVYKQRLKSRHFAAAWDAAIEAGKARVQAYLVEAATRTFDPDELPIADDREIPKVSIGEAINIAKMQGAGGLSKGSGRSGWEEDGGEFVTNEEFEEARQRVVDRFERLKDIIVEQERESGCCHHCGQPLPAEGAPKSPLPKARFLLTGGVQP